MSKLFYRFRRIENLIGDNQELESQNIYFAHPKQLNDPMEGYRDVFWQGDLIVWKNLFKHYLLCLERFCSVLAIAGETHPLPENEIPVFLSETDLPTQKYKTLFSEMASTFLGNQKLIALIKGISERSTPIHREELFYYLRIAHPIALEAIFKNYHRNGLTMFKENSDIKADHYVSQFLQTNWFEILESSVTANKLLNYEIRPIFSVQKLNFAQLDIMSRHNNDNHSDSKNRNLVLYDFSEQYVLQLEQLIYPEWYVACFMSDFSNSSLWGHYGNKHSGVCLIFQSEVVGENFALKLNTVNGWNNAGPLYGDVAHKFEQVDYVKGFGEIDFFRSLGRLPIPKLNATWYMHDGKRSTCAEDMLTDEKAWRERYWTNFRRDILIKSKDWEYEKEYRLILSSSLDSFSDEKNRFLTYDFHSLAGLIFGLKTKTEDKIKIMKIIESKCKKVGRKDFKFYQARYSSENKCIVSDEMGLLNFN